MKNRIWSIISGIAILFLSIMAWYLYEANKVSHDKALLLTEHKKVLEISIAKITEQKKTAEEKLADMNAKNEEALAKIAEYSSRMENMTSEYRAGMEGLTAERDKLRSDIAALNREIGFLKKSLNKIDKKLQEAKTTKPVILEPIVMAGPKNVSGRILEVNKDYEFVIVNLGSDDGIASGDMLFVFRKKALLGRIVVEKTQKNHCAAKILYKSLSDVVEKGDSVNIP